MIQAELVCGALGYECDLFGVKYWLVVSSFGRRHPAGRALVALSYRSRSRGVAGDDGVLFH